MKLSAVIFDYGAVLSTHPSVQEFTPLAEIAGLSAEKMESLYWEDRAAYDRQGLAGEEYWERIGAAAGRKFDSDRISRLIDADVALWLTLQRPMVEYVRLLRSEGYRTGLLSNMPLELGNYLRRNSGLFSLFDHVTLSCDARLIKPEAAIYDVCVKGVGVEPSQAVFLDDRIANVQGSEKYGLPAYHFLSAKQFAKDAPERYGLPEVNLSAQPPLISANDVR